MFLYMTLELLIVPKEFDINDLCRKYLASIEPGSPFPARGKVNA